MRTLFAALATLAFFASPLLGHAATPTQSLVPHVSYHAACPLAKAGYAGCFVDVVTGVKPQDAAYGPSQLSAAYGLPAAPPAGSPTQTIGIVDAYNDPTVESDLASYDTFYGLRPCTEASGCLRVVNQRGGSALPGNDAGWSVEISLDVQIAHGLCPTCHILLVEADRASLDDLATGVNTAASLGATEISNSYGGPENATQVGNDWAYDQPGIAVTVSSGDSGYGTSYPATAPSVIAVGGTSLYTATTGSYAGERAWNGSGSGCSSVELAPSWQTAMATWGNTGCGTHRAVADVSADADPATGVMIYNQGWQQVGGTSLSSPIVAAVIALAGGVAGTSHPASLPYANSAALHDVTAGSNGFCSSEMCEAGPGYDGPTGLGSPNGTAAFAPPVSNPTPTATVLPTLSPTATIVPTATAPPTATATATPTPTSPPSPPQHPPGHCGRWSKYFDYHWSLLSDGSWLRWRSQTCKQWIPQP